MGWSQTRQAPPRAGRLDADLGQLGEINDTPASLVSPEPLRTVFAMNDELLRHGLMHVISQGCGIRFVADLRLGAELADQLTALKPELLVVGAEAAAELPGLLAGLDPTPKVIAVIDGDDKREPALPLIRAGVDGVVDRRSPSADLRRAILRVIEGHSALDARSGETLIGELRAQAEPGYNRLLTRRESEVLGLLTNGLDNRVIASTLFISEATVKFHLHNIMDKFGVHSRAALVATVLRGHARG